MKYRDGTSRSTTKHGEMHTVPGGQSGIPSIDENMAQEVVAYMNRNPSYRTGIDGMNDRSATSFVAR